MWRNPGIARIPERAREREMQAPPQCRRQITLRRYDADWDAVLPEKGVRATRPPATALCALLTLPPPMSKVKLLISQSPHFAHLPQTPPPRRNLLDHQLAAPQRKLEAALHYIVHSTNFPASKSLTHATALLRSAWEDMHHQRRAALAGWQWHKLSKRIDDDRPRLLTSREEKDIRQADHDHWTWTTGKTGSPLQRDVIPETMKTRTYILHPGTQPAFHDKDNHNAPKRGCDSPGVPAFDTPWATNFGSNTHPPRPRRHCPCTARQQRKVSSLPARRTQGMSPRMAKTDDGQTRPRRHPKRSKSTAPLRTPAKCRTGTGLPCKRCLDCNDRGVLPKRRNTRIIPTGMPLHTPLDTHIRPRQKRFSKSSPDHRPQDPQQLPRDPTTQTTDVDPDRGHATGPKSSVGNNSGFTGVLPPFGAPQTHTTVDANVVQWQRLPTVGYAIWLEHVTLLGPPDCPTNSPEAHGMGHTPRLVGRRHPHSRHIPPRCHDEGSANNPFAHNFGDPIECREMRHSASTTFHIRWQCHRPRAQHGHPPGRKGRTSPARNQKTGQRPGVHTKTLGQLGRHGIGPHKRKHRHAWVASANHANCRQSSTRHQTGNLRPSTPGCMVQKHSQGEVPIPKNPPAPSRQRPSPSLPPGSQAQQFSAMAIANGFLRHGVGGDTATRPPGNFHMCTALDPQGMQIAHHAQRGKGHQQCNPEFDCTNPRRGPIGASIRRHQHSVRLEEGDQKPDHQQSHRPRPHEFTPKRRPRHQPTHPGQRQPPGRFLIPKPGLRKLPPTTHNFPQRMPATPILSRKGFVCQQTKPPSQKVLQLADRLAVGRQRVGGRLVHCPKLAEPPMEHHPPMSAKIEEGPSHGTLLHAPLEKCPLVAPPHPTHGRHTHHAQHRGTLRGPRRTPHARPPLVHHFLCSRRLPGAALKAAPHPPERVDHPPGRPPDRHTHWPTRQNFRHPAIFSRCTTPLPPGVKGPKYPCFHPLQRFFDWAIFRTHTPLQHRLDHRTPSHRQCEGTGTNQLPTPPTTSTSASTPQGGEATQHFFAPTPTTTPDRRADLDQGCTRHFRTRQPTPGGRARDTAEILAWDTQGNLQKTGNQQLALLLCSRSLPGRSRPRKTKGGKTRDTAQSKLLNCSPEVSPKFPPRAQIRRRHGRRPRRTDINFRRTPRPPDTDTPPPQHRAPAPEH